MGGIGLFFSLMMVSPAGCSLENCVSVMCGNQIQTTDDQSGLTDRFFNIIGKVCVRPVAIAAIAYPSLCDIKVLGFILLPVLLDGIRAGNQNISKLSLFQIRVEHNYII